MGEAFLKGLYEILGYEIRRHHLWNRYPCERRATLYVDLNPESFEIDTSPEFIVSAPNLTAARAMSDGEHPFFDFRNHNSLEVAYYGHGEKLDILFEFIRKQMHWFERGEASGWLPCRTGLRMRLKSGRQMLFRGLAPSRLSRTNEVYELDFIVRDAVVLPEGEVP